MKKKLSTILLITATIFVFGFCVTILVQEFTKVNNFMQMSDMWSMFLFNDSTDHALFHEVDIDDFVSEPHPVRNDSLISINGLSASTKNYFDFFGTDTPEGEEFEIVFKHNDSLFTTTIATHTISTSLQIQVWLAVILRTLIVLGLITVGLWGVFKQPNSSSVLTLTMFCYSLALQITTSIGSISFVYADFYLPVYLLITAQILSAFTAPLWLKLQLLFPKQNSFYAKHKVLCNLFIFVPIVVTISFALFMDLRSSMILSISSSAMLLLGYVLLIINHLKSTNFIEKRQTKLVLLGAGPGLLIYALFGWFVQLFGKSYSALPIVPRMMIANLLFLAILTIPASLGYAFGKYKLLHVEGKLKRGTRFIAVNVILLVIFATALWAVGEFLLKNIGITSQTPILILGIILAFFFMSLQKEIRFKIEEHFYPERAKLRVMMKEFLASSMARTESEKFWEELEKKLADGLSAEKIYPILRINGKDFFNDDNLNEPAPFNVKDSFIKKLESKDNPLLFDELIASGKITLSKEQQKWFIDRKSAILLPLVTTSGLLGFLVISCKTNGEDFTSEELELLDSFSTQTALVAENLELLGERLEKEKLEEQLKVARSIQQGLLPGKLPEIPGLEISALIRFCLDVAGDYYDVISLENGKIVLSIGDVSGKGVGAALIMANLQASLRTTQAMGASLAESAEKINKIVYENTPPDMFITFFMICIDPVKNTLCYVNAGHNPPFLIDKSGHAKTLTTGGLLFGVIENATYEEGEIKLSENDMILMFTDGVSEAMDENEQEFGEKQIAYLARTNRELPLDDLLALIEKKVSAFHESEFYADDFTLLAARLKS